MPPQSRSLNKLRWSVCCTNKDLVVFALGSDSVQVCLRFARHNKPVLVEKDEGRRSDVTSLAKQEGTCTHIDCLTLTVLLSGSHVIPKHDRGRGGKGRRE